MTEPDIGKWIRDAVTSALRDRGHATVLIAGRSGVGKSTLVNAVFTGQLAETGQGRPVTNEIREYTKPGLPISLIDTRGLELERYDEILGQLRSTLDERQRDPNPHRHVHCAWVCISEDSRRVEPGESALVDLLDSKGIPVVAVITKARADQGFRAEVKRLLPKVRNAVSVRSIPEQLDDGIELPARGLTELVELTMGVIPDGHRNAFISVQKVHLAAKVKASHQAVAVASGLAATAAATPIPFSDAALIVPIQIGMLATISVTFGLEVDEAFLGTLVSAAMGALGATMAGRAIVAGLLKLLPGGGWVAGGLISAATAGALTTTLGELYIHVLKTLFESGGEAPTNAAVAEAFKVALAAKAKS